MINQASRGVASFDSPFLGVYMDFKDALKNGDLDSLRKCPKADLHNHFVLGGSRRYLKDET